MHLVDPVRNHPTSAAHRARVRVLIVPAVQAALRVKVVCTGVQVAGVVRDPEHGDNRELPLFPVSPAPHRLI